MAVNPEELQNINNTIGFARGFYKSGLSLAKNAQGNDKEAYLFIPAAVINFSFATELLLKAAIFCIQGTKARGHKLLSLYQSLPEQTRAQIEELYDRYKLENNNPKILPVFAIVADPAAPNFNDTISSGKVSDVLEMHNEAFEKWRYLHESKGFVYEFHIGLMDAFYRALRDTLNILISQRS